MWIRNIEEYILYEDEHVLVCHKPAGIAVQNARVGTMDLESVLKNYLAGKEPMKMPYLGIIHRLDQPVEGVVVFGKNSQAAGDLSRQMASGQMRKIYLAVTSAKPQHNSGHLEDYLKKEGKNNTSSVVEKNEPGAKKARLYYEVLEEVFLSGGNKYLIRIKLETGRHHQIRVQMSHAGMPLLGDRKYNSQDTENVGLGLCSSQLVFRHPVTKKIMTFVVSPKGDAFHGFKMKTE